MRICLLADAQSPHIARWSAFFSAQDHEIHVLSFRPAKLVGVHVHAFGWGSRLGKARYPLYLLAIRQRIRRLEPDILHAHHATSYGLAGALAGWHPFLIHTWGRDVLDFPRYWHYRAMLQFNLSRADVVTCTSRVMADAVEQLAPSGKPIHVIPFGVDLNRFKPGNKAASDKAPLVIGIVKSLEPVYGVEYLLQAFAKLQTQRDDLQLLIVGEGSNRSVLQSLARELGIARVTRFVGRVHHDQVIHYLHQMDVFAIPSLQESFGVAAIEASAAGLPVVASKVGGLPEVVVDGETGFLVPPADVQALTSRLGQLVSEASLRHCMGEAGRAFVEAHYDWQVNAYEMENLYESLIRKKG